jgi:diguanylate cyclase (GGDEF)-like protein
MNNGPLSTIILVAIIANIAIMSFIVLPVIRRRRALSSSPGGHSAPLPAQPRVINDAGTGRDVDLVGDPDSIPTAESPTAERPSAELASAELPSAGLPSVELPSAEPSQSLNPGDQEPDMDRTDNEPAVPPRFDPPRDEDAGDAIEAFLSDVRRAAAEADTSRGLLPATSHARTDEPDDATDGSQTARPNGRTEGVARPVDRGPDPAALADPVTGLDGPAAWSHAVAQEANRSSRYRRPVAVVIAELDGLTRLEERFGSAAADRLITPVADVLRRSARSADTIARLDRVRFGLLLPETDEIQAINLVERIRAGCDRWLAAGPVATRLSIGWASPPLGGDLGDAIREAESRMHREQRRPAA